MTSINTYIDHTLLKPESTQEQIKQLTDEAKEILEREENL